MLRISVLGPVQVHRDQAPVRLGPKLVELLAVLLVEAGSAVPADRVVELLWGEPAPESARVTLRSHVSHLRRALAPAGRPAEPVVATIGTGAGVLYRLDLPRDALDADRFERWCAEGRRLLAADESDLTERAAALLGEALALWRGPALADVADRPFALARIAQLDSMRRSARRSHAEALAGLDRRAEAVDELTHLLVDDPHDEGVRRLLARTLYAEERIDEAAEVCREGLILLAERGLDAPELQQLQRDILQRRLPVRPAGTVLRKVVRPSLLPPDPPHFVGRAEQLDSARRLLVKTTGRPTDLLVTGAAGVGKTLFAVRLAHTVTADFPDGQLYVNMRGFDPSGAPMTAGEAVRTFLDALAVSPARLPATLEAQVALYRELLADHRVLVVLDNVREVAQVRPLLPGAAGCAVVAVSRNQLAGLVVADGVQTVRLDLLDPNQARQLLAHRLGPARLASEPAAVDEIIERCARLPLALAIAAARATTHPGFPLAALADELRSGRGRLDAFASDDTSTDVRVVFSWSYRGLTPAAARLFRLLGLHPGPDLAADAAASLAGLPAEQVRPLLRELAGAHLITEHLPGRYTFHDLLRAYTNELGPPGAEADQRAALRRMLDHYLHTALRADHLLSPQRDALVPPPVAPGTQVPGLADASTALAWFASEHAVLLGTLDQAAQHGFDGHVWRLAWAAANFLARRGHWHDWARTGRAAVAAAQRQGDRAAQAEANRTLGGAYVQLRRFEQAQVAYQSALDLFEDLGDLAGQGFTYRSLGWLSEQQGDPASALRHDQQALALFERAGHTRGAATTLNSIGWCHVLLGQHEEAVDHCRRSLRQLQQIGDLDGAAAAWDSLGHAYRHTDIDQAIACYQQAVAIYQELGDRADEAVSLRRLGETQQRAGDLAGARRSWQRALDIFRAIDHPDAGRVADLLTRLDSR